MPDRSQKLSPLIQQQLSQIIVRELEFPVNTLVTITKVKASQDNKYATVFISVIPDKFRGSALEILRKNNQNLRHLLGENLKTQFTPQLNFKIDEQELYATEIDKLLDEIS